MPLLELLKNRTIAEQLWNKRFEFEIYTTLFRKTGSLTLLELLKDRTIVGKLWSTRLTQTLQTDQRISNSAKIKTKQNTNLRIFL